MIWLEDDQGEVFRYLTVQELKGASDTYQVGHFLIFCAITLVLVRNARSLSISKRLLIVLLLLSAVASEDMHLHLFNRTTRLSDLGIDAGGILLGRFLATTFKPKRKIC